MRYLITLFLFVLHVGGFARADEGIRSTWTAEIHTGKVYLRSPPRRPTGRSGLERRLEHGPDLPVEDLAGWPTAISSPWRR
jgi:hypothetical protein